jgi:hypothetical protein
MKDLNWAGLIVGVIAWFVIMWYATSQSACLKFNTCKSDDMFIFAIIGVGMLAPAWIAALFGSAFFNTKSKR